MSATFTPPPEDERFPMASHRFDPTTLREYDIRGIVGETLGDRDAEAVGRSFGTVVRRAGGKKVVVGYDGRESSPRLEAAMVNGLVAAGCDVVRIGMGPTGMLYFSVYELGTDAGLMITGSHNPKDYNGFKMTLKDRPFYGADIKALGEMSAAGDWERGEGSTRRVDVRDRYTDRLVEGFKGGSYRIGWDAGNGATGEILERLVRLLPGEHHTLFTRVDGEFPNHHPDPTVEANLQDLRDLVAELGLDFGIAFDGDGDRIGAIDGKGRVVWGDQLLGILAEPVLKELPGSTIIADVKASQALYDRIAELGGKPLMWKTGHSLIKAKMKEIDSPLGGEMSGHIFFKERWFGFDDGTYAGCRLLEILSKSPNASTVLDGLPTSFSTPELNVKCAEGEPHGLVDQLVKTVNFPAPAVISTIDGVRVDWPDGFGLIRASNTTPVLVMRFEGQTEAALHRIETDMLALLKTVKPDATLAEASH